MLSLSIDKIINTHAGLYGLPVPEFDSLALALGALGVDAYGDLCFTGHGVGESGFSVHGYAGNPVIAHRQRYPFVLIRQQTEVRQQRGGIRILQHGGEKVCANAVAPVAQIIGITVAIYTILKLADDPAGFKDYILRAVGIRGANAFNIHVRKPKSGAHPHRMIPHGGNNPHVLQLGGRVHLLQLFLGLNALRGPQLGSYAETFEVLEGLTGRGEAYVGGAAGHHFICFIVGHDIFGLGE